MKRVKILKMQVNYIMYRVLIDASKRNNCYESLVYMNGIEKVKKRARVFIKNRECCKHDADICNYVYISSELESKKLPTEMTLKVFGHDFVVE